MCGDIDVVEPGDRQVTRHRDAACEGQEDSQACTDARVAFEQALGQIHADLGAAETKLKSDLADALATFRSTYESVFGV